MVHTHMYAHNTSHTFTEGAFFTMEFHLLPSISLPESHTLWPPLPLSGGVTPAILGHWFSLERSKVGGGDSCFGSNSSFYSFTKTGYMFTIIIHMETYIHMYVTRI